MRFAVDAHSHTRPAQFPALLLRLLRAADAAMAGAATALKTADVNAHAVIGQSQPERHGNAEILSALRFRPLMLPGARHHDLARLRPHILPVEVRAFERQFFLHLELANRCFVPRESRGDIHLHQHAGILVEELGGLARQRDVQAHLARLCGGAAPLVDVPAGVLESDRLLPQALAGGETKRQQQGQGGSQEARPPA